MRFVEMQIGENVFEIELKDSPTTEKFLKMLPVSFSMRELNGNEKYVYLDKPLPTNPNYSGQIHAGEVMLFGDDCLVLFYKSFRTTYSYTPIGKVTKTESFQSALGRSDVSVRFSLKR